MSDFFRVLVHRNSDTLHLRLEGDFDDEAARQVVLLIGANVNGAGRVFIHTNGLGRIFPVGQEVFHKNLPALQRDRVNYIFTGEKARQIAPKGVRVLI
ncbi:MAG: hypothetical protein CVU64_01940 [Deltaproteobacteria bacterium HGW-Deltaproteobacteria-21]|nr:MAG: hypothetical protein CVU64_01940 [Deltaproteobacteria bacterium HGW-Deltaproteobacteria-21]PKN65192.1 MAG: hypothetical protein CVU57_11175 [Deltaproteobacteria bacterium HGW-Deltaproteobacteria-15]